MTFLIRILPVGLLAFALLLAVSMLVSSVQAVCTLCTGGLLGDNFSGYWDLCRVLGELLPSPFAILRGFHHVLGSF